MPPLSVLMVRPFHAVLLPFGSQTSMYVLAVPLVLTSSVTWQMSSSGVKEVAQPTLDWPCAVLTDVPAACDTQAMGVTVQSLLNAMLEHSAEQSGMVAVVEAGVDAVEVWELALGDGTEEAA